MSDAPILVIFAGPNGSGKSTCYNALKALNPALESIYYVNPDIIAKGVANEMGYANVNELPSELKGVVDLKAGKIAIAKRNERIAAGQSLAIETTASSRNILTLMDKAKANGFKVYVYYFLLRSPNLNVYRVHDRAVIGEHLVDTNMIKRRYARSKALIPDLCAKADTFFLYHNSLPNLRTLIVKQNSTVYIEDSKDQALLSDIKTALTSSGVAFRALSELYHG